MSRERQSRSCMGCVQSCTHWLPQEPEASLNWAGFPIPDVKMRRSYRRLLTVQPCHVPELAPRVAGPRGEDSESWEGSALGKLSPRLRITLLGRWMCV